MDIQSMLGMKHEYKGLIWFCSTSSAGTRDHGIQRSARKKIPETFTAEDSPVSWSCIRRSVLALQVHGLRLKRISSYLSYASLKCKRLHDCIVPLFSRTKQSAEHWLAAQTNRVLKQLSSDIIHLNLPEGVLMSKERKAERMGDERAQGSGSLALADVLNPKPLSEGKRDLDKESMLNVCLIFLSYFSVCRGVLHSEHYL
ncbi:uncharacterized protein J5F26_008861 [Ciconia maguari]